ncbi:hypothetical protein [Brachybacterium sp. GCM10030252]|uniref:hypothetical protein n=1 Tax=Brachybacterium sp. GCM10030252 TaxID=3273380 RepID=UPI00361D7E77
MSRLPLAYTCLHEGCRKVTVSGRRVDEMIDALLLVLFGSPGYRAFIAESYRQRQESERSGPDVAGMIAAKEAERADLDALRAEGGITLRAYGVEDLRLAEEIDQLRSREIAPVSSPALRRMFSAASLTEGWRQAGLIERREVIRILLDVRVAKATRRGRRFDYSHVEVEPGQLLLESIDRMLPDYDPDDMAAYFGPASGSLDSGDGSGEGSPSSPS